MRNTHTVPSIFFTTYAVDSVSLKLSFPPESSPALLMIVSSPADQ